MVSAPVDKRYIIVEDRKPNCISRLFPCNIHCHLRTEQPQVLDQKHFYSATRGKHLSVEDEFTKRLGLSLIFFVFYRTFGSEGVQSTDGHARNQKQNLLGVAAPSGAQLYESSIRLT